MVRFGRAARNHKAGSQSRKPVLASCQNKRWVTYLIKAHLLYSASKARIFQLITRNLHLHLWLPRQRPPPPASPSSKATTADALDHPSFGLPARQIHENRTHKGGTFPHKKWRCVFFWGGPWKRSSNKGKAVQSKRGKLMVSFSFPFERTPKKSAPEI